jgi:hypothetical protein
VAVLGIASISNTKWEVPFRFRGPGHNAKPPPHPEDLLMTQPPTSAGLSMPGLVQSPVVPGPASMHRIASLRLVRLISSTHLPNMNWALTKTPLRANVSPRYIEEMKAGGDQVTQKCHCQSQMFADYKLLPTPFLTAATSLSLAHCSLHLTPGLDPLCWGWGEGIPWSSLEQHPVNEFCRS